MNMISLVTLILLSAFGGSTNSNAPHQIPDGLYSFYSGNNESVNTRTPGSNDNEEADNSRDDDDNVTKPDDHWEVEGDQWDEWPTRDIRFETDEGTWMNLDVCPDGEYIVFDLLGDIYRIPLSGGEAELLSGGAAFDMQPRYSPDGEIIAFTSDRGGGDNIWLMNADGSDRRAITDESFRLLSSPFWTPDGDYIVARKHFTGTRSLGAGEIWMYHVQGGTGLQLTEKESWTSDQNEPAVSADGRWLYYSFSGPFDYNRDVHEGIYQINRFDRQTGRKDPVTRATGGGVRPTPSPDGEKLAFVRRIGNKSALMIRDIESGRERVLYDGLDLDQQETWAIHGLYPAFAWTPDNEQIIISFDGKINRIEVETGSVTPVPFEVMVEKKIADAVSFDFPVADDTFRSRMIRWPSLTPDKEQLIFQAAGHIYRMDLPDGKPERITESEGHLEYAPSVSDDGRYVVYTTWDDEAGGHVKKVRLDRPDDVTQLTSQPDQYANPVFSPDGDKVAFLQGSGIVNRGKNMSSEFFLNIKLKDLESGEITHVTETPNRGANRRMPRMQWSFDGSRLYYFETKDGETRLSSIKPDGSDDTYHVKSETAEELLLSPDTRYIAFKDMHNIYVAPMPRAGGDPLEISAGSESIPTRKITRYGGDWISWSADSRDVVFALGDAVYRQQVRPLFDRKNLPEKNEENRDDWRAGNVTYDPDIFTVELELPVDKPSGITAYQNARIITMDGEEVIENGTILVEDNRILEVGPMDEINIPDDARVFDVYGKTIMPGIVDVHAHMGYTTLDITPDRLWEYEANLAYGVTTTHDPSASTQSVFALAEQVKSGRMTGPRIYSTGYILYGAENPNRAIIESLDDARYHLKRHRAVGATSVKSYNQPRRDQRQWVLEAAREVGLNVFPEGGSMLQHNITMIIDGHTGIEHAIPVAPLRTDMLALLGVSNVGYTPTLVVGYGGIWGENYWYQKENVFENRRLLQFVPRHVVDARSRRRLKVPDEEFYHFELARSARQVVRAGGRVQLGAHGQLQGLAAHWELWMLVQGGMTEMEALRAATIHGADYIGLADDLGSIEPGKLADFIVLNQNPLDDIAYSESIYMVVKNGRVWDSNLNELFPRESERKPFRFER
ncbi:amidohydrolase family protein [Natronogracilivirga saccharolytica]|nr:amidohydrolase family protein [Natronogracilivirga saccharolytica]